MHDPTRDRALGQALGKEQVEVKAKGKRERGKRASYRYHD